MNEIAGIFQLDGAPVEPGRIQRMLDAVASWPADRVGLRQAAAVGLGARQFFITPEDPQESLPLQAGACLLTADARLDNRRELLRELAPASGGADSPLTDGALILNAYERWGEECPGHLAGDFAFALWDARAQRLFCARDAMGARPFYYCHRPGAFFAFGTTIEMVLQGCAGVDTGLNELKLGLIMALDYSDREITIRKHVLRLPGGHSLSVGRGRFVKRRYWELEKIKEIRLASDEEYAAGLRQVFFEAVRCRLRSRQPVGAQLSGGLDSSSVAMAASQLLGVEPLDGERRLHTFSAVFPKLAETSKVIDERQYQQAVVEQAGNLIHHPVACDDLNPLHDALWLWDQPRVSYNSFLDRANFEAARDSGVRVMLTGYDGDTAISHGFGRLSELAGSGRWIELYRQSRGVAQGAGVKTSRVLWRYGFRPFWRSFKVACAGRARFEAQFARIYPFINREFAKRINLVEVLWRSKLAAANFRELFDARASHIADVTHGMWAHFLESYDWFSRKNRMEARHPFFDRRVVEYSLAIPPSQKLQQGVSRYVMRNAMRGVLPEVVSGRTGKADLSACFYQGMRREVQSRLADPAAVRRPIFHYIDRDAYQAAVRRIVADSQHAGFEAVNLFGALVIARWLEQWTPAIGSQH